MIDKKGFYLREDGSKVEVVRIVKANNKSTTDDFSHAIALTRFHNTLLYNLDGTPWTSNAYANHKILKVVKYCEESVES